MKFDEEGQLRAINPDIGYFTRASGVPNESTLTSIKKNTIFTNVAFYKDDVWWEGLTKEKPELCLDWQGRHWTPKINTKAAHVN
jgi:phosphoenolpyruvate carboxykinase (GTP)